MLFASPVFAGSIDTAVLEQPWPKAWVHTYGVWKSKVQWRQEVDRKPTGEEIFAGADFTAPSALQRTWKLATDYGDLGTMTPGVESVTYLENAPNRQVVQVDVKVLWRKLRLTFEIEREEPKSVRFRMVNEAIGDYRGVCLLSPEGESTHVELATWFKPAVRISSGVVLWVERVVILKGIRNFLKTCERVPSSA